MGNTSVYRTGHIRPLIDNASVICGTSLITIRNYRVQITQTLVSVGHATDLRQALNRACGNSHEDPTQDHVEDSTTASLFRY